VEKAEASEQHKSVIGALKAAAPKWEFEHNWVIVSFLQRVQGGARPTTEGSKENIGHNVHV